MGRHPFKSVIAENEKLRQITPLFLIQIIYIFQIKSNVNIDRGKKTASAILNGRSWGIDILILKEN
jgi:hypothetical protein